MNRTVWVLIVLSILALTAGCNGFSAQSPDSEESQSPEFTGSGSQNPPYGTVQFYGGRDNINNSTYYIINNRVRIKAPRNDSLEPTTFEDVVLCLYDNNGSVINSTVVGNFEMPLDNEWVTISASPIPKYVVIDHPRFRTYGDMAVVVYVWDEAERAYDPEWGPLEELDPGFEYPRHNDTGRCM